MKLVLARAALAASVVALASAAHATGEGVYIVEGANPGGASPYHGQAELKQVGEGVWEMHRDMGDATYTGHGVGDSQATAITYHSGGQNGTVLCVTDGKGRYRGVWADDNGNQVGVESLTPATGGGTKP